MSISQLALRWLTPGLETYPVLPIEPRGPLGLSGLKTLQLDHRIE
jgi:hypothetical protein